MTIANRRLARAYRIPAVFLAGALLVGSLAVLPAPATASSDASTNVSTAPATAPSDARTNISTETANIPMVERAETPVGEAVREVSLDGVDAAAASTDDARDEAQTLTTPAPETTLVPEKSAAKAIEPEADPEDDLQLAALSPVQDTAEFTAVGLTWTESPDVTVLETAVRIREGGVWSDWKALETISEGDESGVASGTEPLLSLGANGVQARVLTTKGEAPRNLQVSLVSAGTAPTDGKAKAVAPTVDGAALRPALVTRSQWGAKESQANTTSRRSTKLQAMYVHHTASTNKYTKAQAYQQIRSIYNYHTKSLGWDDIGYQFLVDRFGTIYEGRRGALTDLTVGAQAGGYNANTIGVSAIGNFDTAAAPKATVEALTRVLAWKGYQYGLDALGKTTLTTTYLGASTASASNGTKVTVPTILGHRDTNSTACPGRYLYPKLGAIRKDVAARIKAASAKYGKASTALRGPAAAGNYSASRPILRSDRLTLSWKSVAGTANYQVMTRSAGTGSVADSRLWNAGAKTKGLSLSVPVAVGTSVTYGVRAIDHQGRVSPATTLTQTRRPAAPGKPVLIKPSSAQSPFLSKDSITLAWKSQKSAAKYRVDIKRAAHGKKLPSKWTKLRNTTSTKQNITLKRGESALVSVRAISPDGLYSQRTSFSAVTRSGTMASLKRSTGSKAWQKISGRSYLDKATLQTRRAKAELRLTGVRDARRVQVVAARGKGHGRIVVYAGSKRVKTINLNSTSKKASGTVRYSVTLPKSFSGTVKVVTLDKKTVRVSRILAAK